MGDLKRKQDRVAAVVVVVVVVMMKEKWRSENQGFSF